MYDFCLKFTPCRQSIDTKLLQKIAGWMTMTSCPLVESIVHNHAIGMLNVGMLSFIVSPSPPPLQKNHGHNFSHFCHLVPRCVLARYPSTTARPRHTRRRQTETCSSSGPPNNSGFPSGVCFLPSSAAVAARIPSSRVRCSGLSGRWKTSWFRRADSCVAVARGDLFSGVGQKWVFAKEGRLNAHRGSSIGVLVGGPTLV